MIQLSDSDVVLSAASTAEPLSTTSAGASSPLEAARPDHEMPIDMRVRLLKLCAFIDRRTFELLARPEPEKVQVLININRQVASGLAVTPGDQGAGAGGRSDPSNRNEG